MYDGLLFGVTDGLVEILANKLIKNDYIPGVSKSPSENNWMKNYVLKPAITSLLYTYLYNSWYKNMYSSNNLDLRWTNENYIFWFIGSGLTNFLNAPLMSLFGWQNSFDY